MVNERCIIRMYIWLFEQSFIIPLNVNVLLFLQLIFYYKALWGTVNLYPVKGDGPKHTFQKLQHILLTLDLFLDVFS